MSKDTLKVYKGGTAGSETVDAAAFYGNYSDIAHRNDEWLASAQNQPETPNRGDANEVNVYRGGTTSGKSTRDRI